jgi:hypothetical protein
LFFRRAGGLQGGDLLVECSNRILGARQAEATPNYLLTDPNGI